MNKHVILILLFFISFSFNAQENTSIENRRGQLFFKVGSDYRITPIYNGNKPKDNTLRTNIDSQSSGAAFFYGVEFFPGKNWSLNFNHSFHYTLFYLETFNGDPDDLGGEASVNQLFYDFHFYVNYYIKIFKESEVFVRVGKSMFNRNSNYTTNEAIYDDNGNFVIGISSQGNFNFSPYNLGLGYKKDRVEVLLGIYSTSNTQYLVSESFIIPYFNLAYTIGKM
ncbi:hypothetical protein Aeqsu_1254 [Aequorivita sublithincola DSM 14238]|uniref:Outer membrane protein beta-barrel domain-containing protein n=1 Tax=Aequorivita sublithincola (strain DSM 14238 / LMG 21431 / ACAM 643 / 9-3) TaxID=746697 RepID=I3YUT1_AEQSU|nr:hypothetical protein [Aequorivita sublithincola]AFL80749.1 hypothetical protein Aeqsu_1254 [Aequorivita sublithincola DSM 14238]